jgi:hypothetical protein
MTLISLFETYHRIVVRNLPCISVISMKYQTSQERQVAWEASSAPPLTIIHHLLVVKHQALVRSILL